MSANNIRFSDIYALFDANDRKHAIIIMVLIVLSATLDLLGVASIMPFVAVISNPDMIETNQILSQLSNIVGANSSRDLVFSTGILVFCIYIIAMIVKALSTYAQTRFAFHTEYRLATKAVSSMLRKNYQWFLSKNSSELGVKILSEVTRACHHLLLQSLMLIANGVLTIFIIALLFIVDPVLTSLIVFILGGSFGIVFLFVSRYLGQLGRRRLKANQDRFVAVNEVFGAIKDVKQRQSEDYFISRFERPAKEVSAYDTSWRISSLIPKFLLEGIAFGGMLLLMLLLFRQGGGVTSALPLLALYAFAGYRLMPSMQNVYHSLATIRYTVSVLGSLISAFSEFDNENPVDELNVSKVEPLSFDRSLVLKEAVYSYPNTSQLALDRVSMEIKPGERIGIVGLTGSGKSTLVDVLLGLLDLQSGELKVDGEVISHSKLKAWRATVGFVPQSIYLTDESILKNVGFGLPAEEIDTDRAWNALRLANLDQFVRDALEDGIETLVGERGLRLSGGQRQRIGVARALYDSPKILIFDEATSALDNMTERAVVDSIASLKDSVTTIMVAHRLSTVRNCDRIFLMEEGRVIGSGTYDDLLENSLRFKDLTHEPG